MQAKKKKDIYYELKGLFGYAFWKFKKERFKNPKLCFLTLQFFFFFSKKDEPGQQDYGEILIAVWTAAHSLQFMYIQHSPFKLT